MINTDQPFLVYGSILFFIITYLYGLYEQYREIKYTLEHGETISSSAHIKIVILFSASIFMFGLHSYNYFVIHGNDGIRFVDNGIFYILFVIGLTNIAFAQHICRELKYYNQSHRYEDDGK